MSAFCVDSVRKLRNGQPTCGGKLRDLSLSKARECGFQNEVSICLSHYNKRSKKNNDTCCYPFTDGECRATHLTACPQRLLKVFDELRPKTGTKICRKHLEVADQETRIINRSSYENPRKRKVNK